MKDSPVMRLNGIAQLLHRAAHPLQPFVVRDPQSAMRVLRIEGRSPAAAGGCVHVCGEVEGARAGCGIRGPGARGEGAS
jgi:hypothetical protein